MKLKLPLVSEISKLAKLNPSFVQFTEYNKYRCFLLTEPMKKKYVGISPSDVKYFFQDLLDNNFMTINNFERIKKHLYEN